MCNSTIFILTWPKWGEKKYFTCGKTKKGDEMRFINCWSVVLITTLIVNQVKCLLNLGFIIQTIDFGMQKELLRETDSLNIALNTTIHMEMVARNQLRIKQNPTILESVKAISTLRKRYLNQQPLSNLPRKCPHMIQNYKNLQKRRKKKTWKHGKTAEMQTFEKFAIQHQNITEPSKINQIIWPMIKYIIMLVNTR